MATAALQPQPKHWVARHKVWTAILVLVAVALAVGLAFCGPW